MVLSPVLLLMINIRIIRNLASSQKRKIWN